jgi:hypothetical protein
MQVPAKNPSRKNFRKTLTTKGPSRYPGYRLQLRVFPCSFRRASDTDIIGFLVRLQGGTICGALRACRAPWRRARCATRHAEHLIIKCDEVQFVSVIGPWIRNQILMDFEMVSACM